MVKKSRTKGKWVFATGQILVHGSNINFPLLEPFVLIVHSASMSTSTFTARYDAGHFLKCSDIMGAGKNGILKKFC